MKETIRKRSLPAGWYPDTEYEVLKNIESWDKIDIVKSAKSVVVPHAGWFFSGKIAANTIKQLSKETDIIIIAGGHLSEYDYVLVADEDYFETPMGNLKSSHILKEKLRGEEYVRADTVPDNTVEVQLPFVKKYFPESEIIWMRVPPEPVKVKKTSELLILFEKNTGKKISVIGSTDLTHYGINYGFMTHGRGEDALSWVKNVNDKNYIDFLLNYKINESLKHSLSERSACSAGGAALAACFASDSGCRSSELVYYYTSNDIYPSESFVGYAGIIFY